LLSWEGTPFMKWEEQNQPQVVEHIGYPLCRKLHWKRDECVAVMEVGLYVKWELTSEHLVVRLQFGSACAVFSFVPNCKSTTSVLPTCQVVSPKRWSCLWPSSSHANMFKLHFHSYPFACYTLKIINFHKGHWIYVI